MFAENYLRKIIQLPLVLPGRTADQRFGFVSQLFSPTAQREYRRATRSSTGRPPSRRRPDDGDATPFSFDPAAVVPPRVQILREVQDTKEELEALDALARAAARQPARAQAAGERAPARQDPAAAPRRAADRRAAAQARGLAGVLRRAGPSEVDDLLAAGGRSQPDDDERPGHGRRRAPERPRPRAGRHAGARRPDLAAGARPAGGYSPAARSGVRSSGSASSISFVKMRSLRL